MESIFNSISFKFEIEIIFNYNRFHLTLFWFSFFREMLSTTSKPLYHYINIDLTKAYNKITSLQHFNKQIAAFFKLIQTF